MIEKAQLSLGTFFPSLASVRGAWSQDWGETVYSERTSPVGYLDISL